MTVDCHAAREALWPPEKPRLCDPEVVAAREHFDGCPACQEFLAQDRSLLGLYARLREECAPQDVRERVFDELSRARWDQLAQEQVEAAPPASRLTRRRLVLGLSTMVILVAVSLPGRGPSEAPAPDEAAMFVEDYLRRAVGEEHIESGDPEEIVRFLTRELGMALRPLELQGLELKKAEICLFQGRRGALIVYEKDGASIAHYLVPGAQSGRRAPRVSTDRDDDLANGMPVVTWSTETIEQALVGEVDPQFLLRLAAGAT